MSSDRRTSSNKPWQGVPRDAVSPLRPRRNGDPLYEVVARTLQQEIESGVHPVGTLLPTEAELRERFSVSRHTIREALRKLRNEKLVSSRQGAGTLVEPLRHSDEFVLKTESINDLISYSSDIWLDLESAGIEAVTGERAASTGIRDGEEWLVARGFLTGAGSELPVCWGEHFIHSDYRDIADQLAYHRGPVFRLIEDAGGLQIVEIEQEITGELIPAELAAGLGVEPASAAIQVKRVFATASGKIAQVTFHTHPASRFRFTTTMRRPRG